jgi:signal transduction histidine kinase
MNDTQTILVVDDNEAVLQATARLLRQAGHRVIEASTGEQGLALVGLHHPDVVLLDVVLPDLDGLEVCRRIRADPTLSEVFIVMASGTHFSSDQQAEGLRAGADGYVPRPVGNAELVARVEAFLRIRRAELALRQREKMAAIGTLASGVAHEINNPLMGIMGYAQLLQEELGDGTTLREYADEIVRETQRVADIVRSLSSFTQRLSGERRQQSPAIIVREIVPLVEAALRAKRVRLEVELPTVLPDIRCCAAQVRQVLLYLIANSREALSDKYPNAHPDKIIRISAQSLDPGEEEAPARGGEHPPADDRPEQPPAASGWLRITVEDHGPGISDAIRACVFDPFFTTRSRAEHSGLGLATSRRIVQEHGGRLTLETLPGQWTRFHVDLPAV